MTNLETLPDSLAVPVDDGACDHLRGARLPAVSLPATSGCRVDLGKNKGWTVIYVYPMTGVPGVALPEGWDDIPGARGCTPQSCSFRDHKADFERFDCALYGISAQPPDIQKEAKDRLHLPYDLLSDSSLVFARALNLPTFHVAGQEGDLHLIKRLTMVVKDGVIKKVFYPVFPPDKNAEEVLSWLKGAVPST